MVYNITSFALENTTFEESVEYMNYLDESHFLIESAASNIVRNAIDRLKRVMSKVKSGDYSEDEIKDELDEIYDSLKVVQYTEDDNVVGKLGLSMLSFMISWIMIAIATPETVITGIIIGILGIIVGASIKTGYYDAVYKLLVELESKVMMEKRKAKKSNNEVEEKNCDKVIAFVEKFKNKRRDELRDYYRGDVQDESTDLINESDKHEVQVNNFRQTADEINRLFKAAKARLELLCNTTLFCLRKGKQITLKNKDKILNEIIDKGDETEDIIHHGENFMHTILTTAMVDKYSNKIGAKYSKFGMAVREKIEARIASYTKEISDYMDSFLETVTEILEAPKGTVLPKYTKELHTEMRKNSSVEAADKAFGEIAGWYNATMDIWSFINGLTQSLAHQINSNKIKATLRYKILSKFVK